VTTTCWLTTGSFTQSNVGCDGPAVAPRMAAANASARGQRHAILRSPLAELTGFVLIVDCRGGQCGGERCRVASCNFVTGCLTKNVTGGQA